MICYCRSGDIREVLIFANYERRTNSRILESHEIIIIIALPMIKIENLRILDFESPKITSSRKSKHAKISRSKVFKLINCGYMSIYHKLLFLFYLKIILSIAVS